MTYEMRPGDVVAYRPESNHCHEGMAIARVTSGITEHVALFDTYWGDSSDKLVRPAECALVFNLNDYDLLDRAARWRWERYNPADRQTVTHQHGLQVDFYVRKGATEDRATIISNARQMVSQAEEGVRSAQLQLDGARRLLAELEGGAS